MSIKQYDEMLPTLLISLHPENTAAIIAETKIIEYRRRFYQDAFQAFVYTTGAQGGIELFIRCDKPIQATATVLGQIGALLQHDDADEISAYFAARNTGLEIPIVAFERLPKISLATMRTKFSNFVTPQGYTFLDKPERQDQLTFLREQPGYQATTIDWQPKYDQIKDLFA